MSHCARKRSITPASHLNPCKTSATTIPVRTNGSLSSIIRRSSAPPWPGDGRKKSTQTELSTRITLDFSATSSNRLARRRFRNTSGFPCGFLNAPADQVLGPRSAVWSGGGSVYAPSGSGSHRSRCWFCPYTTVYTICPTLCVYVTGPKPKAPPLSGRILDRLGRRRDHQENGDAAS